MTEKAIEIRTLEVPAECAGERAMDFVVDNVLDYSSGAIQRLLTEGYVVCGDSVIQGGTRLTGGETLTLNLPDLPLSRVIAKPYKGVNVIYQDSACMVVNKPNGLGVTPDRGQLNAEFLGACTHHLQKQGLKSRPRIVHRLDKETSGAVIVALHRDALRSLTRQFEKSEVRKDYLALVQGVPYRDEGEIDLPIGYEIRSQKLRAGGRDSKPAKTGYEVVEKFRDHALVRAWPVTGRQHQIRVHLEAVGHPLAVDRLYGGQTELLLSTFKRKYVANRTGKERPLLDRLALHAERIRFVSPANEEETTVSAELPKDLRITLRQLRRWAPAKQ